MQQITVGRATVETFSGRTVTAQARVRYQVGSCGIFVDKVAVEEVCIRALRCLHQRFNTLIILHELTNRLTKNES